MAISSFIKQGKRSLAQCLTFFGAYMAGETFAHQPNSQLVQAVKNLNASQGSQVHKLATNDIERSAKALRWALGEKYLEIESPNGAFSYPKYLKTEVFRKVDISDLILRYLPVGMPLADAQVLLENAGFEVSSLGQREPREHSGQINAGVYGRLQLKNDKSINTSVAVTALSNDPEGKTIAMANAAFRKQVY